MKRIFVGLALGTTLLVACEGQISDSAGSPETTPLPGLVDCSDLEAIEVGSSPLRRLTPREYTNTLNDLLGEHAPETTPPASEGVREGSFENEAALLGASDLHVRRWDAASFEVGRAVAEDPALRAQFVPCAVTDESCPELVVRTFGSRAFRRPLSEDEIERFTSFFRGQQQAIDFDAGIQLTVSAMLNSPAFLYRLELGVGPRDGHLELSSWEVASRLSYLIWQSMPDDELLSLAEGNTLYDADVLESQALRMLQDERAHSAMGEYFRQWLYLDKVASTEKLEQNDFPEGFTEDMAHQSVEEAEAFMVHTFMEGTLGDMYTSRYGDVPDSLRSIYGDSGAGIMLPPERAGLLTRAAFLVGNAHRANPSPPLRGVYVIRRLLCQQLGAPPPDADTSPPARDPAVGPQTNRMLFEERSAPAECQVCHTRIDGYGFGFEAYDMAGEFRQEDNGLPIDASGYTTRIGDEEMFDGATEMQELFANNDAVHECAVEKWATYAFARPLEAADSCQVRNLQNSFLASGGDFDRMVLDLVRRPEFLLRALIEQQEEK